MSSLKRVAFNEKQKALMETMLSAYDQIEYLIERDFTAGRERSIAITKLHESQMWLGAALAASVASVVSDESK